ncbi:MAG: PAS domain S-box protein [Candidatus Thermoplasmatota archaeon]|nr:PAS domain S-box protein [Candidatus Thermoplasmatota archaeon]MBS3802130.1 PAS domain S-box protein [Candidatus Thermoplasmatota archaeon]
MNIDYNRKIIDMDECTDEELLLDACPYAMIIASVDGFITLSLNDAAAKIFKKSKKELIGDTLMPLIELTAAERRRQVIHRLIDQKKPYLLEDYERGIWWRTFFQPIQNEQGKVTKIAVVIHNISAEKKREQQQIEKNEEFWTRLIEYSNNAFLILDKNGIIRYASESVKSLVGYAPRKLIGDAVYTYIYDADIKKAKDFFSFIQTGKSTSTLSHRVVDKDGIIKYIQTTANNLLDNPIIQGIIVTSRDVTKTYHAEVKTKEMKQYLENIINSTSDIIFSLDDKQKVTIWNKRIAQITGYTSKSMTGKNLFSISLILKIDSFKEYIETCYKRTTRSYDVKIQTKHGDYRLLRLQGSMVRSEDGEIKGVVFTGKDITSDAQIHGHLVSGLSYLILDEHRSKAVDLMKGLLLNGYNGLMITRDYSNDTFADSSKMMSVSVYSFSQKMNISSNESTVISDPSTLIQLLIDFFSDHEQSIALIDRLDFLIALHGFRTVMQTIYQISSIASNYNGIVLVRLNPSVVSSTELAILGEELERLPDQNVDHITIDKKLFDILRFVDEQNRSKSLVSYKHVSKTFSITKVTTAKRMAALAKKNLITIKKRGRLKTIYITDKGKRLLQRRNVL